MSSVVADPSPPAPSPPTVTPPGPGPGGLDHACPNCGASMVPGQDWCLDCGMGAPGSFGRRPGWTTAAAIIGATVLLAAAALAASYAALNRSSKHVTRQVVAQATPTAPDAVTPAPATTTPTTAAKPPAIVHPTATPAPLPKVTAPATPAPSVTPAPTHPVTPAPAPAPAAPTTPTTSTTTTHTQANSVSPKSAAGVRGSKVILDPDASSTYNPYGYPDSRFGDPSLAIDGDPTTAWTAVVDPAVAPRNASGLVLDLKAPQKLSDLKLNTSTPKMEVEIYGATGDQPPPSITDPAWHHLAPPRAVSRDQTFKLLTGGQKYRFIVIWITRAQSTSKTAKMAISEVTLYH